MNKYVFKHSFDNSKLIMTLIETQCTEILRQFCYFLKGVSFSSETIYDALEELAEEYQPEEKDEK